MYAVINSGGKQHRVEEGEQLKLEKIEAATGETIEFDEMIEWRVCSWELPDTIACVIRCENSKTGKVTEHTYQQYKSAEKKIEKLISDPHNTLTIATQNAIGQTSHELNSLLDD